MRFFARVLVCVVGALAIAGCNPINDKRYMDEGAGVELGYAGIADATKQQDIYVKEICQQAGYQQPESPDGAASCMDNSGWNRFVMAGINDINRRCDGYLTWLDARRRDRAPVLKEFLAASAASHSILTVSGADSTTLDIVSAALALAGATYENWNSRLLLAINQSTVVDIVYSRQAQFVEQLNGKSVDNRASAIYVLRNYLRLCMPTTIEADINTSMTLIQRGSSSDAKSRPVVPLVGVPSARQYLPSPPDVSDKIGHPLSGIEEKMARGVGINIQKALKVKPADGDFGPETSGTRLQIKAFEQGYYMAHVLVSPNTPPVSQNIDGVIRTDPESRAANAMAAIAKGCEDIKFASNYEMGVFLRMQANGLRTFVNGALDRAQIGPQISPIKFERVRCDVPPSIRSAIKLLQKKYGLNENGGIDEAFMQKAKAGN